MAKVQHTCTGCVPIDSSIIETYVALINTNEGAKAAEIARSEAEAARVLAESARVTTFAEDHDRAVSDHGVATSDHATAEADHTSSTAATSAANAATTLAEGKAALVQQRLDTADADHTRADSDHTQAASDHTLAGTDHTLAGTDHSTAAADHTQAGSDHTRAEEDHTLAASDHTLAASDHAAAAQDHTVAGQDHTQAAADHTAAAADHETAAGDHTASTAATSRANAAAAAAEQMVDIKQGPKGDQGNTGSSVDYPYELVNNLTTDDATKGLSAAQGVVLEGEISQLSQKVSEISTGKYYGYYSSANDLPENADVDGYAYVGTGPTYTIYNCQDGVWTSSGVTTNQVPIGNDEDIDQDTSGKLQFADRAYNSQSPDGMGYVILRKNKTFAEQVTAANTIYEIRYDFDITGGTITLPNNCVLRFIGGSIQNGSLALNGAKIIADTLGCFKDVVLSGNVANEKIDVRVVGIYPNQRIFDTGAYIKNYLLGVDGVEWFFPAGSYYLSELHITKDKFCISGVPRHGNSLTNETIFWPFNSSQYYIIKLGGETTALSPTNSVRAQKIYDIQFSCPSSFTPKALTNEYTGATATYTSALLVLDFVAVGTFALGGSQCYANIPAFLFGQIYECLFDYMIMYGAQCKSDCPRLQIVTNQSNSISACHIKLFMAENVAGKLIATSENASINGLVIHQLTFEGVVEWITGVSDVVRYGTAYKDYTTYLQVPMLDMRGYASITIDQINLSECNQEWTNSADSSEDKSIRTLASLKGQSEAIRIGKIINDGNSSSLFVNVTNVSPITYTSTMLIDELFGCDVYFLDGSSGFNFQVGKHIFDANGQTRSLPYLSPNYLYRGNELMKLTTPKSVTNVGTIYFGAFKELSKAFQFAIRTKNGTDRQLINANGFIIDTDYLYLIAARVTTNIQVSVSYRDSNDAELGTTNHVITSAANTVTKAFIKLVKPSGTHHIVLFNNSGSYPLDIYGIMAVNSAVYAPTSGTTRPAIANVNKGFVFYDETLNKALVSNGSAWVNMDGTTLT